MKKHNNIETIGAALAEKEKALADPGEGTYSIENLIDMETDILPTLIDPILQQTGIAALYGSSDTGKSALARQLVMAVCAGDETFLGFRINTEHRRAVYVSTEDDEMALSYLFRRQFKGTDHPSSAFRRSHVLLDTDNLFEDLDVLLHKHPADLVVIDTFADLFIGDSHRANEVRGFLKQYAELAKRHKLLVLFLHHTVKGAEDYAPSKNSIMGSQGFESRMRMTMELRNDLHAPEFKHLCITKGNYIASEFKQKSFVLHFNEHLLFTNTGKRTPFDEIVAPKGDNYQTASTDSIDWEEIFDSKAELKTSEIVQRLAKQLDMPERTAKRRIGGELCRVARGIYRIPPPP